MTVRAVILVEPNLPGNVGAALRVAANFGVERVELVRPVVPPTDPEVIRWACGADRRVEIVVRDSLQEAAASYRTTAASASGRGRPNVPVLHPRDASRMLSTRGLDSAALVFGNETRGLSRDQLDQCDLVVRVPTVAEFPVLNLAQAVAILTAELSMEDAPDAVFDPLPATQSAVDELMEHLHGSLAAIGFLDPQNPQRILRKLRRLFGRAGITADEIKILRGVCRQMEWAAQSSAQRRTDEA
jgi:TrmH family RNA methyltransferase